MRLVVDSSVVIKWVVDEDGSEGAGVARRNHMLAAPDLIWAEIANILWKKVRLNEFDAADIKEALALFKGSGIVTYALNDLTFDAMRLSVALNHPAYDCFYIALAQRLGCPFVTADQRLVNKVTHHPAIVPAGTVLSLASVAA